MTATARRKPAVSGRLEIRVSLDPHMGAIYEIFSGMPARVRHRELLALARANLTGKQPTLLPQGALAQDAGSRIGTAGAPAGSGAAHPAAGLDHLAAFAADRPPVH